MKLVRENVSSYLISTIQLDKNRKKILNEFLCNNSQTDNKHQISIEFEDNWGGSRKTMLELILSVP